MLFLRRRRALPTQMRKTKVTRCPAVHESRLRTLSERATERAHRGRVGAKTNRFAQKFVALSMPSEQASTSLQEGG